MKVGWQWYPKRSTKVWWKLADNAHRKIVDGSWLAIITKKWSTKVVDNELTKVGWQLLPKNVWQKLVYHDCLNIVDKGWLMAMSENEDRWLTEVAVRGWPTTIIGKQLSNISKDDHKKMVAKKLTDNDHLKVVIEGWPTVTTKNNSTRKLIVSGWRWSMMIDCIPTKIIRLRS